MVTRSVVIDFDVAAVGWGVKGHLGECRGMGPKLPLPQKLVTLVTYCSSTGRIIVKISSILESLVDIGT